MRNRYPIRTTLKNAMKVEKKPKTPTKANVRRVVQMVKEANILPKDTEDVKQSVPEAKKTDTLTDTTKTKKLDDAVSVEPNPDGHYELNSLMTRMVQAELQNILIKIWHELPDNPSSDAEKLVVDIMKNKASDDLRNVLGLNVTKRLLNIHNALYVKLKFSLKPDGVSLKNFLSKYNISAFKRIDESVNIFAAQLETINDFDRICVIRNLRCGNAKVTVTPCYKFTHCPFNLKTIFDESNEKNKGEEAKKSIDDNETAKDIKTSQEKQSDKNVINTTTNIKPKKDNDSSEEKTKITNEKQDEEKDKCQPNKLKSPKSESTIKVETSASTNKIVPNDGEAQTKTVANSDIKLNVKKSNVETSSEKANVKETIEKTSNVKINLKESNVKTSSEKAIVNESIVKTTSENANVKASSMKITNDKVNVKGSNGNTSIQKPNVKESDVKTTSEKTNVKKLNVNVTSEKTNIKETNVNITKANVKKSNMKIIHERAIATKPLNKNKETTMELDEHDDDELDDNDILALMSEAIILDECSGSDED